MLYVLLHTCQYISLIASFVLVSCMIKWTLRNYLDTNELSAYRLAQTAKVSPATVYALARGDHERVSLEVLDKVLTALEHLTGKPAEIGDLLEREPDPEEMDEETRTWLESGLSRLSDVDPYEWAEGEAEEGEALHYVPGQGWASGD